MTDETPFEDVPAAPDDAVVDEHWQELRGKPLLPDSYMPPAMGGPHGRSLRGIALLLIGVFAFATVCGVCLTYGPGF